MPKKIVFGFLNGESWGYLGSKKLLADLRDFKCQKWSDDKTSCLDPQRGGIEFSRIALDHVDAVVEVKQVGAIQPGTSRDQNLQIYFKAKRFYLQEVKHFTFINRTMIQMLHLPKLLLTCLRSVLICISLYLFVYLILSRAEHRQSDRSNGIQRSDQFASQQLFVILGR